MIEAPPSGLWSFLKNPPQSSMGGKDLFVESFNSLIPDVSSCIDPVWILVSKT